MEQFWRSHTNQEQTTIISWLFPACWKTWRQMSPALCESVALTHPLDVPLMYTPRPLIPWKQFRNVLTFSIRLDSFTHSFDPYRATFCIFSSIKKKTKLKQRQLYTAIRTGICLYSWVYLSRHFVNYLCKYI